MSRARARYYVGVRDGWRQVFAASSMPTTDSHGRWYSYAIGPFRTKRGARYMARSPWCPDVAMAEYRAKREGGGQ